MKNVLWNIICLGLLLVGAGCVQKVVLTVDKSSLTVPETGGEYTVQVNANAPWNASSSEDWVFLNKKDGELLISIAANDLPDLRTAIVTLSSADQQATIKVVQNKQDVLRIETGDSLVLTGDSQTVSVSLVSNYPFTVSVTDGASWCDVTQSKGLISSSWLVNVTGNPTDESRTAVIEFRGKEQETKILTVIQTGRIWRFRVNFRGEPKVRGPYVLAADGSPVKCTARWESSTGEVEYDPGAEHSISNPIEVIGVDIKGAGVKTIRFDGIRGVYEFNVDYLYQVY